MKTLIIYDSEGYILSNITGSYRVPKGVPYMETEVPEGKRIKYVDGVGINVTTIPHQIFLEDIPKSDIGLLKEQVDALNIALAEMIGV